MDSLDCGDRMPCAETRVEASSSASISTKSRKGCSVKDSDREQTATQAEETEATAEAIELRGCRLPMVELCRRGRVRRRAIQLAKESELIRFFFF